MDAIPIRALDKAGNAFWYTGKAGKDFVSPNYFNAFLGYSLEGARRKATQLNRMTEVHGLRFVAVQPEHINIG